MPSASAAIQAASDDGELVDEAGDEHARRRRRDGAGSGRRPGAPRRRSAASRGCPAWRPSRRGWAAASTRRRAARACSAERPTASRVAVPLCSSVGCSAIVDERDHRQHDPPAQALEHDRRERRRRLAVLRRQPGDAQHVAADGRRAGSSRRTGPRGSARAALRKPGGQLEGDEHPLPAQRREDDGDAGDERDLPATHVSVDASAARAATTRCGDASGGTPACRR